MKIIVLNAEAGGNKGAEAMLEVLINRLFDKFENCSLYLEVSSKQDYYDSIFLKKFKGKSIRTVSFKPKNFFKPYSEDISIFDCAIDIGGINFHNKVGLKGLIRSYVRYLPFIMKKIKLIFFTQDFGPAKKSLLKFSGRVILGKSSKVFARSSGSFEQLINTFKLPDNKVKGPYPDSTLVFHSQKKNFSKDYISLVNKIGQNYIILCPSAIMHNKIGDDYINYFVDLANKFKEKYEVVLLVHNFTLNEGNSTDLSICQKINSICKDTILIDKNISTSELKKIIGGACFSISSRYHVVVGAISQDVPSLAIGWNPKYLSFLSLYKKENWNIDFSEKIIEVTDRLINKEFLESKLELNKVNDELKLKVEESFKELMYTIDS